MPNRIELPDDLASLIEKREQEDRRVSGVEPVEPGKRKSNGQADRRSGKERRSEQYPPESTAE
ncbi:MAG: hypothetical protein AAF589_02215 [Planctomycetota bacterium]